MRNVEGVRFRAKRNTHARSRWQLVCTVTLSAPEQELNTTRQAAVGVLSLRRALKLGKLLVGFASIRSSCDLRPQPNQKGLGPPVP